MEAQLIKDILQAYSEGMFFDDIKKNFKTSNDTIYKILKQYGTPEIEARHNEFVKKKIRANKKHVPVEDVVQDLKDGIDLKEVADKYGVHKDTIKNRLKTYEQQTGIKLKEVVSSNNKKYFVSKNVKIPIEEIIEAWENGVNFKVLADKYGVTEAVISDRKTKYEKQTGVILERKEIKRRNYKKIKEVAIEELVKDIESGMLVKDIAKKHNISESTLRVRRREYESKYGKINRTADNRVLPTKRRPKKELPMEEVVRDIKSGMKIKNIGIKYGVSTTILNARRKEYEAEHGKIKKGHDQVSSKTRECVIPKANIKQIWAEHIKGVTIEELSSRYKISPKILQGNLIEYRNLLMAEAYLKGVTIRELARNNELPIMEVKENLKSVLTKCTQRIPVQEYLLLFLKAKREQKEEGYTDEQMYRNIILEYRKKQKQQRMTENKETSIQR